MIDLFTPEFKNEHNIEEESYVGNLAHGQFLMFTTVVKFKGGDTIEFNKEKLVLQKRLYVLMLKHKIIDYKLKLRNKKIESIKKGMD